MRNTSQPSLVDRARRHPWSVATAAALLAGVATGWFMQGQEIGLGLYIPAALTMVLTACVAVGGVLLDFLERMQDRGRQKPLNPVAKLGFVLLLGEIVSILSWALIHDRLVTSALRWSEQQTTLIDRYQQTRGSYPSDLAEIVDVADGPRLLRYGDLHYEADDTKYWFELTTGFLSAAHWDSTDRVWHFYD